MSRAVDCAIDARIGRPLADRAPRREPLQNPIDDAERSEGIPIQVYEGYAGVKSNVRFPRHQRIGREPFISKRVRHFKNIPLQDSVGTICRICATDLDAAWRVTRCQAIQGELLDGMALR